MCRTATKLVLVDEQLLTDMFVINLRSHNGSEAISEKLLLFI